MSLAERAQLTAAQTAVPTAANLQQCAQSARQQLAGAAFPDQAIEPWKYTNLRWLDQKQYFFPVIAAATSDPNPTDVHLLFRNGYFTQLQALPRGIRCRPLNELAAEHQALLSSGSAATPFKLLNSATALTQAICIECVTPTSTPLRIRYESNATGLIQTRTLLLVSHELTLMEEFHTAGNFANDVLEIEIAAGAQLNHLRLHQSSADSASIGHCDVRVNTGAVYRLRHQVRGTRMLRDEVQVQLKGRDAQAHLCGALLGNAQHHADVALKLVHAAPGTMSRTNYRGVAADRARLIFNGSIEIPQGSEKCDADLQNKNLLLSNAAEINTKPELTILTDDVRCSHGATVGQFDQQALFYLRSRGIDLEQGRQLLLHAFVHAPFSALSLHPDASHLANEWLTENLRGMR